MPQIKSKIIHNIASDHKPVALTLGKLENLGPVPFKFSSTWNNNEEVKKIIAEVWKKPLTGSPIYVWENKLKSRRRELKHWARINQLETQKIKLETIEKIDRIQVEKEQQEESHESI